MASLFLVSCNYYEAKGLDALGGPPAPTGLGPTEPGTPPTPPTFATIDATVFKPFCLRCHQGDEPAGGLSIGDYRALIDDGWVVAGDPENSSVYTSMVSGDMPKRGAKPTAELIESVREWIANGALEQ